MAQNRGRFLQSRHWVEWHHCEMLKEEAAETMGANRDEPFWPKMLRMGEFSGVDKN
jgi:hypothetical protein